MRRACARAGALGRARSNAAYSAPAAPGLARPLMAPLASAVAAAAASPAAAQFPAAAGPRARVRALHASSSAAAAVEKGEQVGECRDGPLFAVIGKQQRNVCVSAAAAARSGSGRDAVLR